MGYPTRIDLCDGKYSVIYDFETGRSEALRYGEKWRDLRGDKMVLAMFDRIVELEEQLKTYATILTEELIRGRLIGVPQKLSFAGDRGMKNLDEVTEWMITTRGNFEALAMEFAASGVKTGGQHDKD